MYVCLQESIVRVPNFLEDDIYTKFQVQGLRCYKAAKGDKFRYTENNVHLICKHNLFKNVLTSKVRSVSSEWPLLIRTRKPLNVLVPPLYGEPTLKTQKYVVIREI